MFLDFSEVTEITGATISYGQVAHGPHIQTFYAQINGKRHYRTIWFWIMGGRKVYDPTGWQGDWKLDYTVYQGQEGPSERHTGHVHLVWCPG